MKTIPFTILLAIIMLSCKKEHSPISSFEYRQKKQEKIDSILNSNLPLKDKYYQIFEKDKGDLISHLDRTEYEYSSIGNHFFTVSDSGYGFYVDSNKKVYLHIFFIVNSKFENLYFNNYSTRIDYGIHFDENNIGFVDRKTFHNGNNNSFDVYFPIYNYFNDTQIDDSYFNYSPTKAIYHIDVIVENSIGDKFDVPVGTTSFKENWGSRTRVKYD